MKLWRVSQVSDWREVARSPSAARWHTKGHDILYTSSTDALALIEALAHLHENPCPHRILALQIRAAVPVHTVAADELPRGWRSNMAVTRAIGDRWLREARSPLLRVSSVHCIESCNVLINPRHPGLGRVRLMRDESFRFPVRLRRNAGA